MECRDKRSLLSLGMQLRSRSWGHWEVLFGLWVWGLSSVGLEFPPILVFSLLFTTSESKPEVVEGPENSGQKAVSSPCRYSCL